MGIIRSRIKENLSKEVMEELFDICKKKSISDNNKKVSLIEQVLLAHEVDYHMLGPGTNRVAVLIDNYVFKIAMDDWGLQDNRNEFTNSYELQPFVIKTYEVDKIGLISVCEYVTLISRDEFMQNQYPILKNLSILSDSYLLGDVGYTPKNFTNWGIRDNGDLVILDFAYIYQISTDIIKCSKDNMILEYNHNFTSMTCPRCHAKYSFMDIRRRIPREFEYQQNELELRESYMLKDESFIEVEDDDEENDGSEYRITRSDVFGLNDQKNQQNNNVEDKEEPKMLSEEELELKKEAIRERLARQYQSGQLDEPLEEQPVTSEIDVNAYIDPAEFRRRLAAKDDVIEPEEVEEDIDLDDEDDGIDPFDLPDFGGPSDEDEEDEIIEDEPQSTVDVHVQPSEESTVTVSVGGEHIVTDGDTVTIKIGGSPEAVREEESIVSQHYAESVEEATEELLALESAENLSPTLVDDESKSQEDLMDEVELEGKFFGMLEDDSDEDELPSDEDIANAYSQGVGVQVANEEIQEDAKKWHSEPDEIVEHVEEKVDKLPSDDDIANAYFQGLNAQMEDAEPEIGEIVEEDDDSEERYLRPLNEEEVDIGKEEPKSTNAKRNWTI